MVIMTIQVIKMSMLKNLALGFLFQLHIYFCYAHLYTRLHMSAMSCCNLCHVQEGCGLNTNRVSEWYILISCHFSQACVIKETKRQAPSKSSQICLRAPVFCFAGPGTFCSLCWLLGNQFKPQKRRIWQTTLQMFSYFSAF